MITAGPDNQEAHAAEDVISLTRDVVPHSGTAGLARLSGHAAEARPGVLTLTYSVGNPA